MIRKLTLLVLLAASLPIATLDADELADLKAAYYGLPVIESVGALLLPVTVDGHEGALLVDSGAGSLFLDLDIARKWNLKTSRSPGTSKGIGGEQKRHHVHFEKMLLGGTLPLGGLTKAYGQDLRDAEGCTHQGRELPRIGIIGLGVLKQFGAVLDYQHDRLLIPRGKDSKPLPEIMKGAVVLPLRYDKLHYLTAVVAGHKTEFLVDSGAQELILNEPFCNEHKMPVRPTKGKAAGFGDKQLKLGRAKVGELTIGESITMTMDELTCFDFSELHPKVGGLFGHSLLKQLRCVYDMGGDTIYVRR